MTPIQDVKMADPPQVLTNIPPPARMEMQGDPAENWKYFKASWQNYETFNPPSLSLRHLMRRVIRILLIKPMKCSLKRKVALYVLAL